MTEFPNALLTAEQVARILKVNKNRVGEYAASGILKEQVPMSIERIVGLAKLYNKPELIRLRIKGAGYDGDY